MSSPITGREYPAVGPYLVAREKIRDFALATKNTHRVHREVQAAQQAGYADLVAPPTFLVTLAQRAEAAVLADPEAEVDFSRVVHADERFSLSRPIVAGDELLARATVASDKALGGHRMVTTETVVTDATDTQVATVRSSLLVRAVDEEA
ncbi:FAS1-like dehydratase domain-containing protein [Auritidibacter ignavus]|uniref:FAS1-like dehydratase domain-containing protein n=1 Tax=Auritidibacter ignavus TaxID=678932 RepID=UPI0024BBCD9D|nr:MaoC family dehydratase N-terminal domain-containing protein [Auritidibacter ignavus]WHS28561.1 MaoC family dehydratase N-terminal domain-containing protein [Auritidibacter ignavus]